MLPLPSSLPWPAHAALAVALLLACDGCQERPPAQVPDASVSQAEDVPATSATGGEAWDGGWEVISWLEPGLTVDLPSDTHLLPLAGEVDVTNRYLSAVQIFADFDEQARGICGGALIGRRLVLTAGHCVCQRRALSDPTGAQTLIDGSACAKTASVKTEFYSPSRGPGKSASSYGAYQQGTVRPHPALRVLLDEQGQVVSSHADLALILLDEPVDPEFRPIPLASRDVHLNESIVIVGPGYDETADVHDGERRYSRNKIKELLPSGGGRMRIEQPGAHHYRGDSGGPCLREGVEGIALVGISARNLGQGEAITSTYGYRDWLRGAIHQAKRMKLPKGPK